MALGMLPGVFISEKITLNQEGFHRRETLFLFAVAVISHSHSLQSQCAGVIPFVSCRIGIAQQMEQKCCLLISLSKKF
jgi:hypothetical protein